jgi:hypothetical protein
LGAGILFLIAISVLLGYMFRGRKKLPHGIVLSAEELIAHADDLRVLGVGHDTLASKYSGPRKAEAVTFNDRKSTVYVFDGDTESETYVVIEMRGCIKGPPLLPPRHSDGSTLWRQPDDLHIPLASYIIELMMLLRQEDWSGRVVQELDGKRLARYQAAVQERFWRILWDALLKPFTAQRTAYRGYNKCRKAPDLLFGTNARCVDEDTVESYIEDSMENGHGTEPAQERSAANVEMNEGVVLPAAAEWLEFWSQQHFPQRWTFIEFASNLGEVSLPPRSRSSPDLSLAASEDDTHSL